MPTIRDVAKLAQCSTATVSRFFNQRRVSPDTERRILDAVEALAFSPNSAARMLKLRRSMTLGMIIPDITEPFFPVVVQGVEDVARANGYALMIFNTREDEANELRCVDLLLGRQCDGLLLIKAPSGPMHEQCRERLARFPMPIVYLDRRPDAERDAVLVDNETGACRAVEHLLRLGHRKIAIVTMGREVSTHASRFEGYRRALADFGVAVRDDYVQRVPATFSDAYSATLQLLGLEDPPSALFATNGRLTTGAMSAIQSRKLRCPEDVSVIGFDAFEWQTVFRPRLTVVDQPAHVMGRKAAELLVERVTGLYEGPARRIVLNTELIVRESCGVYRGHPSNATHGQ